MTKRTTPESESISRLFDQEEPKVYEAGYVGLPADDNKRPLTKGWTKSASLTDQQRLNRRRRYPDANIGILAGTPLSTGRRLNFVDTDHDGLVRFVRKVMEPVVSVGKPQTRSDLS